MGIDAFALPLLQPTRAEVEQIRLSLIELRCIRGASMIGLDNWRLYYPIAEAEFDVSLPTAKPACILTSSSSNTSLNTLIAVADEHLARL